MHLVELLDRVVLEQKAIGRTPTALLIGADVYYRLRAEIELSGVIMIKPQHESLTNSYRGLPILEGMLGEFRVLSAFRS